MRSHSKVQAGPVEALGVRHAAAFVASLAVSCALLLPKLLPPHVGRFLSNSPADGSIFLWSLGWWPHAVSHGTFLPYTHALFAPGGTNLAWTTSISLPALLVAPITAAFGVFASFNVLSVLAPATAAWTTYLLVHRVTRRWWASLAAGLLFSLSPLETTEVAMGHLNLSLVALVPLLAYLVVRRLQGTMRTRTFVLALGMALAGELAISTEVLATTTLFGAVLLLLLYAWDRDGRPALARCARAVVAAYALAAGLAAPILYAAFALPRPSGVGSLPAPPVPGPGHEPSGLAFAGSGSLAGTNPGGPTLGWSWTVAVVVALLLVVLVPAVWRRRRDPAVLALTATALLALVLAPARLTVGSANFPTPWALARHVPLVRLASPQRLTMFAWLIASVGVGVWLAERPPPSRPAWRRWAVAAAILASTLPPVWSGPWTSVIERPAFLSSGHPVLAPNENVAVVAGPGPGSRQIEDIAYPTVWQVQSGFSFRLANAYVGTFRPELPSAVRRLVFGEPLLPGQASEALAWLRQQRVGAILVMRATPAVVRPVQRLLGANARWIGGVAFLDVPPG